MVQDWSNRGPECYWSLNCVFAWIRVVEEAHRGDCCRSQRHSHRPKHLGFGGVPQSLFNWELKAATSRSSHPMKRRILVSTRSFNGQGYYVYAHRQVSGVVVRSPGCLSLNSTDCFTQVVLKPAANSSTSCCTHIMAAKPHRLVSLAPRQRSLPL